MDENAQNAKQKIGGKRWNMIMASVDSGTFDAQKMNDFSFGLGLKVGGNHKRRVGPERKSSDRSEMARIFGDWQLCDEFHDMSEDEVIQKLISLLKSDEIGLNPLARALGQTLNTNKAGAAGGELGSSLSPSGPAQATAAPEGRLSLHELMKPEVRKPHRGKDFLENLAYECKFGEDFETYVEGLPAGTNPDKKVQT